MDWFRTEVPKDFAAAGYVLSALPPERCEEVREGFARHGIKVRWQPDDPVLNVANPRAD